MSHYRPYRYHHQCSHEDETPIEARQDMLSTLDPVKRSGLINHRPSISVAIL